MQKTPQDILGVGEDATAAEITAAYRRAAMRLHPDRNPNNPRAKEEFQELQKAYQAALRKREAWEQLTPQQRRRAEQRNAAAAKHAAKQARREDAEKKRRQKRQQQAAEEQRQEAEKERREDAKRFPNLTIFFTLCAAISAMSAIALPLPLPLLLFSFFIMLAALYFRPQKTYAMSIAQYAFKLFVKLYFVCLLMAGLWFLFSQNF